MLLESPSKLRGTDSPVKKLRDHALALKSPLKDVTENVLNVSPIKGNKGHVILDSPSKIQSYSENQTIKNSPIKPIPLLPIRSNSLTEQKFSSSKSPFLDAAKESISHKSNAVSSVKLDASMESMKESTPFKYSPSPIAHQERPEENVLHPSSPTADNVVEKPLTTTHVVKDTSSKDMHLKSQLVERQDDQNREYDASIDASMDDLSFQAIRKSIRRSILRNSKPSAETSEKSESSFKHVPEGGSQQSSLVVNQGSVDSSHESRSSNTTMKISLKDAPDDDAAHSNTPQHNRQSQGFALLPHRDPLTVKSAKKLPSEEPGNLKSKSPEEEVSYSPQTKLSPLLFKPSLYPSMKATNDDEKKPPVIRDSEFPEVLHHESPSKIPIGERNLKNTLAQTKPLEYSPPKDKHIEMMKSPTNSPLSNLFATVGSTLRKARNKFSKDNQGDQLMIDHKNKIHKPKKSNINSPKVSLESPSKRDGESVLSRLTAPTEASQAKSAKRVISGTSTTVIKSPTKNNSDLRSSLKFSPVKSIYGSLRLEMNRSVQNSPSKKSHQLSKSPRKMEMAHVETKPVEERTSLKDQRESQDSKITSIQSKSLTRMSLSKPQKPETKENTQSRKSSTKGLASIPLESSSKNYSRFRPKSLVSGDLQPLKRKTQTEEEIKSTSMANQPYRKIGTKIVPPPITQAKQQQDAKRRRTADQLQSVLQKRALRVSNSRHDQVSLDQKVEQPASETVDESKEHRQMASVSQVTQQQPQLQAQKQVAHLSQPQPASRLIPQTNTKHSKHGPAPNTQTLMKTAVLQHARMNNDSVKSSSFQNGSMGKGITSITPVTPKAPTVLPEIFSESDDDEEGSVLKDWANSPELRNILMKQQHIDPDQVFGPMAPLHMEDIFRNSRLSRFKGRGSSAQWSGQDGLTIQEIEKYKQKTYKK